MKPSEKEKETKKSQNWLSLCFSYQSIKQIFKAGCYSLQGFRVLMNERAFVQELVIFIIAIPFAFYLADNKLELILLIFSAALVILVEALNTAIEVAIDRVGDEIHPLSKAAKDIGSFAVLFSIALAIFVWLAIGVN